MFLHVEQKIAAIADAEKVRHLREHPQRMAGGQGHDVLPELADIVRAATIAALGNIAMRGDDVVARELAIEREAHEAARTQQRTQDAPAGQRIAEMMQHAAAIDHVETAAERAETQNVGVPVFDVA